MSWGKKKRDPMLDGSRPVYICYDPDLHREWKTKLFTVALVAFAAGVLLQWLYPVLP